MSEAGWISINKWREFQTYDTSRNQSGQPPWIRVYTKLMRDDEYLELSPNRVAILHRLWLEYASSSCRLRADTRSLSRRLFLRVTTSDLEALNHAGFISIVARKTDAEGAQPALASRAREEVEVEEDSSSQVGSVASSDGRPDLDQTEGNEEEEWGTEPERPVGYDLPTLEERANLEQSNGMGGLDAEVLSEWRTHDTA